MTPFKSSEFSVFISGLFAVLLLGYISHNSVKTKIIKQKELVYQDREVIVTEIDTVQVIETEMDTLFKTRFIPLYLSIDNTEFEAVFSHYRKELGACSTFDWNGNIYVTRLETESKDICAPEIR